MHAISKIVLGIVTFWLITMDATARADISLIYASVVFITEKQAPFKKILPDSEDILYTNILHASQ